jgi:hypothetical protein
MGKGLIPADPETWKVLYTLHYINEMNLCATVIKLL